MRNQSRRAFRDDYASNTAPALGFDTGGLNFSATVACVPTHRSTSFALSQSLLTRKTGMTGARDIISVLSSGAIQPYL